MPYFCKWIISTYEPMDSNLKWLFQYKLSNYMPSSHKRWFSYVMWAFIKNHVSSIGSKIKIKILKAWKNMMEKI